MTTVTDPASFAVVVPVYNEAGRLDHEAFAAFLDHQPACRLRFVDDGSTDSTVAVLEALAARYPGRVVLQCLGRNAGKGEAVRRGVLEELHAGTPLVIFTDADLSAPLAAILDLLRVAAAHPDAWAIFGSRVKLLGRRIARSELRHYLGRVFATFASAALALPVYDTQCGIKLFRNVSETRAIFAEPFMSRWIFDVEVLARLARHAGNDVGRRVREMPLEEWTARGSSRLGISDFGRAPLELLRIRVRYGRAGR